MTTQNLGAFMGALLVFNAAVALVTGLGLLVLA
jgi:hypothetical protein